MNPLQVGCSRGGNSRCQGPEAGMWLVHARNGEEPAGAELTTGGKKSLRSER